MRQQRTNRRVRGSTSKNASQTKKQQDNPLMSYVGSVQTVDVLRLNDDGEGVAKFGDVTVFIPGALPGESVVTRVRSAHRRHLTGELLEVKSQMQSSSGQSTADASPRTSPLCPVFDECGGCSLQHLSYGAQLRHKAGVVASALQRVGKIESPTVLPTAGMKEPWRYRNQIQVPLLYDEATGRLAQGFFAEGSHSIVETSLCLLVPQSVERTMQEVPQKLADWLKEDAKFIHHLIIRHSVHTGEQMIVLCARKPLKQLEEAGPRLLVSPIVSVAVTIQERPTGPVWGDTVELVAGQPTITERLSCVDFLISPRSFFQVNTRQAEALTEIVEKECGLTGGESVLDAYCGTGTFSLTLARHASEAVGVEWVAPAVSDAKTNARHNNLNNAFFHVGAVEDVLPEWIEAGKRFDVAVIDPPRKGCHPEVLQALITAGIERIVYVSCNPATLARDIRVLMEGGYEPGPFQPVDMFPHTNHIECVVRLDRVPRKSVVQRPPAG